jgi:hypothetical protein
MSAFPKLWPDWASHRSTRAAGTPRTPKDPSTVPMPARAPYAWCGNGPSRARSRRAARCCRSATSTRTSPSRRIRRCRSARTGPAAAPRAGCGAACGHGRPGRVGDRRADPQRHTAGDDVVPGGSRACPGSATPDAGPGRSGPRHCGVPADLRLLAELDRGRVRLAASRSTTPITAVTPSRTLRSPATSTAQHPSTTEGQLRRRVTDPRHVAGRRRTAGNADPTGAAHPAGASRASSNAARPESSRARSVGAMSGFQGAVADLVDLLLSGERVPA